MTASASPILALDPGNRESAWVLHVGGRDGRPLRFGKEANERVLWALQQDPWPSDTVLVVEMMRARGMPFSNDEMRTLVWLGRFIQAWTPRPHAELFRMDVKVHVCGQARANDGNIRQALIERWGGKAAAIGRKATPGPLYGISADVWQALALAVTWAERVPVGAAAGASAGASTT